MLLACKMEINGNKNFPRGSINFLISKKDKNNILCLSLISVRYFVMIYAHFQAKFNVFLGHFNIICRKRKEHFLTVHERSYNILNV